MPERDTVSRGEHPNSQANLLKRRHKPISEDTKKRILALYDGDQSIEDIRKRLHLSALRIRMVLHEAGVVRRAVRR